MEKEKYSVSQLFLRLLSPLRSLSPEPSLSHVGHSRGREIARPVQSHRRPLDEALAFDFTFKPRLNIGFRPVANSANVQNISGTEQLSRNTPPHPHRDFIQVDLCFLRIHTSNTPLPLVSVDSTATKSQKTKRGPFGFRWCTHGGCKLAGALILLQVIEATE